MHVSSVTKVGCSMRWRSTTPLRTAFSRSGSGLHLDYADHAYAILIAHGGTILMLTNAIKLVLATTAFALFAMNANAQDVHPNCVKSKDKVKCNCLFTNGGSIENFSGRPRAVIWTMGQVDLYLACVKRNGR